jgi:hypothetical protein
MYSRAEKNQLIGTLDTTLPSSEWSVLNFLQIPKV